MTPGSPAGRNSATCLTELLQVVLDGLRHGHFRCAISSVIGKGNRREIVIEAGKSHKFTGHASASRQAFTRLHLDGNDSTLVIDNIGKRDRGNKWVNFAWVVVATAFRPKPLRPRPRPRQ